jgi:C2 domain
VLDESI